MEMSVFPVLTKSKSWRSLETFWNQVTVLLYGNTNVTDS